MGLLAFSSIHHFFTLFLNLNIWNIGRSSFPLMCLSLSISGSIHNSASWEPYAFWKIRFLDNNKFSIWKPYQLCILEYLKSCILEICSILYSGKKPQTGNILYSAFWKPHECSILETCSLLNAATWKHPLFCILKASWVLHPRNILIAQFCILVTCSMVHQEIYSMHYESLMSTASWKPTQFCILETCSMLFCILKATWELHPGNMLNSASSKLAQCCSAFWKPHECSILETCSMLQPGNTLYSAFWKPHECCILETCSLLNAATWKHSLFCILKASWVLHPRNMLNSAS